MPSLLRQLQAEWNTLVPQARDRGIPRVRPLAVDQNGVTTVLETIAYRRTKLEWLRAQLAPVAGFDTWTFGVELEFISSVGAYRLAELISAAGVPCEAQVYNHRTQGVWKIVTDGSLRTTVRGHVGLELVSPPLRGEAGFAAMRAACRVLTEAGCRVNKSCGLHVHVGAAQQHVGFFKNLVRLYAGAQDHIDQFMSPSRRGHSNLYCRPVAYSAASLEAATSVNDVARAAGQSSDNGGRNNYRYKKLNLSSFWQHGTIEFRHHQGTVEAQKAENWTRLCLRMCIAALEGPKQVSTMQDFFEAVRAPDAERSYFQSRVEHFRAVEQRRAY